MEANKLLLCGQLLTVALLVHIAIQDIYLRKVPNWTCAVLLACVLVFTPFHWVGVLVALLVLVTGWWFFCQGWLGAGDSKLLAILMYACPMNELQYLITVVLLGGVLSAACWLYNQLSFKGVLAKSPTSSIPYAVAICTAAPFYMYYL